MSFSVAHGEVFGLLGPNGSGKTTLIKILANLVLPDSGAAFVEGINVARRPFEAAQKLQTVLAESIGLEKRITARQNLILFASLYNLPKAETEERIDKLLEFFGLTEVADKTSQSYSTGMARKLSVARTLLSNASIVVFDEPTSGLDPSSADDFRRLIKQDLVKRSGKTVIMATHNLEEAKSMCDRIALLGQGRLLAIGSPAEVALAVEDRLDLTMSVGARSFPSDSLRAELLKVEGVISVDITGVQGDRQIRLTGRKDMDYFQVFSVVNSHGLNPRSLETSSPSLEEAFLRLTREGRK
ncbi:MAG: ABC transporter ATP-binding protein [Thaumarchaeota archaeon]|nr:ABC transporter ATP-binding protein [Nitrososphaerota archaeon]